MTPARFSAQPGDTGLYRREFEHDACGVALVATMRGTAGSRHRRPRPDRAAQPRPPGRDRRRPARRRRGGHPHPDPRRVPARGRRLRPAGHRCVCRGHRLPARRPGRAGAAVAAIEAIAAEEGLRGPRLARGPGRTPSSSARWPATACRSSASSSCPPTAGRMVGHRPRPPGLLPAQARRARGRGLLPVAVARAPWSTRACSPPASSSPSSPTSRTGASPAELALVHSRFSTNTFPSLAAGPPLPADRAQRRDQHRQGQPQLDARAREPAGLRRHPRRPRAAVPDLHARRPPTRPRFDEVLELLHLGGRSLPHACS